MNLIYILLFSLLTGLVLSVLYVAFKVIKLFFERNNLVILIFDILYFLISSIITFVFVLIINNGHIRFYIISVILIGWLINHLTLGKIIFDFSKKIVNRLKKLKFIFYKK
ncbi:MAG: spore cortex biosynthesis protein YabQ [Candidatus Improbicoccus pseudotrichonymphae]|uniref:Spore cortex biosynthesis protein YabQ n=1 Tax=Candidatus Improbicoccus pseudotrichonymphae TaxID=3033792 RepID=A0AA48IGS6_9FIRM|nr:MAG: spore cortex biosynthesis protein YabQ [Candidatus Improbicoccus pseudotrichonymphae]